MSDILRIEILLFGAMLVNIIMFTGLALTISGLARDIITKLEEIRKEL